RRISRSSWKRTIRSAVHSEEERQAAGGGDRTGEAMAGGWSENIRLPSQTLLGFLTAAPSPAALPMHFISKDHNHELFDRSLAPVATVSPGAGVMFETLDACCGEVRSVEQLVQFRRKPPRRGDPLTGPVFVRGAKPGHTLVVDILKIELDPDGFQLIGPNRA